MPDLPADDVEKPSVEVSNEPPSAPQDAATPPASEEKPIADRGLDWRLIVIVGIAVLFLIAAYVNRKLYGPQHAEPAAAQQPGEGAQGVQPPEPKLTATESYARMAGLREADAEGATFTAPGGRILVLAYPAVPAGGKENAGQVAPVIPAKLFDITQRVDGLRPEMLDRRPVFPGNNQVQMAYMNTFPALGVDPRLQMEVKEASLIPPDAQTDAQPVVGIQVGTQARAYPVRLMNYHDVINDTLGGAPIVVSWSAWAGAASAMLRGDASGPDAAVSTFGSSGLLYQCANVLYDTRTFSLWSATERRCIAGERTGARLQPLQAVVMSWQAWKTLHPETTLLAGTKPPLQVNYNLNPATPPDYLFPANPFLHYPVYPFDVTKSPMSPKAPVFGVTGSDGQAAKAYPVALLRETKGAFEDTIGGRKVTLQFDPDTQWLSAKGADGPPLLTEEMLWTAWYGAHPKCEVWQPEKPQKPAAPPSGPGAAAPAQRAAPPPAVKPVPAAGAGPVSGAQ